MGAGASVGIPEDSDLKRFIDAFASMADQSGPAKGARAQAWMQCDPNSNGQVSLAELDGWVQKSLRHMYEEEAGDRIWKAFRPSYIRAFNDAKDIGTDKQITATASTDDYLQRGEFRLCCAYLCLYAMMYDAFALLDGGGEGVSKDDDRKVTREELGAGYKKVQEKKYGFVGLNELNEEGLDKAFKEMDKDGKGAVMLKEWCAWIEENEKREATAWGKCLSVGEKN
jgi:hypothetical protein